MPNWAKSSHNSATPIFEVTVNKMKRLFLICFQAIAPTNPNI
ncbi:hypothetical protein GXM_09018 [Nostoc sphaeroides CCNUC1]|uniref:Uncharacterized protein n=1 Tax=Nostoc sphaeroides CCNUC1 TaxID=2653204 RepID=A0A5P8WFS0_9NOSO|nr:hypothetical protein GXM_09018 [Nostoc sphaeroides CCNUC1]